MVCEFSNGEPLTQDVAGSHPKDLQFPMEGVIGGMLWVYVINLSNTHRIHVWYIC